MTSMLRGGKNDTTTGLQVRDRRPSVRQGGDGSVTSIDVGVKTAILPCAGNIKKVVTLGVPDYHSEYAYTNGQCLALAVALAESLDNASVALFLRSDGRLYHAAAFDEENERYIDYLGWMDAEEFEERYTFDEANADEDYFGASQVVYLSADDARNREASIALLPKQNYRVAKTFVADVLAGSAPHAYLGTYSP